MPGRNLAAWLTGGMAHSTNRPSHNVQPALTRDAVDLDDDGSAGSNDTASNTDSIPWSVSPRNPHNWSSAYKLATLGLVAAIGMLTTMTSSLYAPFQPEVESYFHTNHDLALLPISLYNIGMALGPLLASPLSETLGRRAVYMVSLPAFCLFVLGAGLTQANNFAVFLLCRFLAGVAGSPAVAIAAATVADLWPREKRALALVAYYSCPYVGALLGPLIGGLSVDAGRGWRWSCWIALIGAGIVGPPVLGMRESYARVLLRQGSHDAQGSRRERFNTFVVQNLGRPVQMLLTEPIVSLLCLYMAFQFGLLYAFVVASPGVYERAYGFDVRMKALSFLGLIAGALISPIVLIVLELKVYRPRSARRDVDSQPEDKLYGIMLGSVLLPIGLFTFAYTARPSISFYVPMFAQAVTMLGSMTIYVPAGMYLLEVYGARYGASASGANSLLRYVLAASFPLFAGRMFDALGTSSAVSVLGGWAVAMAGIPWGLRRWGSRIRKRSKYASAD